MLNTAKIYGTLIGIAATLAAFALYSYVIYNKGYEKAENKYKLEASQLATKTVQASLQASEEARQREADLQDKLTELQNAKASQLASVARRLDAAVASLRDRPERPAGVSEAPRPACTGANGAELAASNGIFLAGYAARAAKQDAALAECYAVIDRFRSTVNK